MPEHGRINVFYSYAHRDETYRERLSAWLDVLREERIVNDWYDRKIVPGADWEREIARNLERSHIVLLLISPAFMASEYSLGIEVKRAVELHWQRRCRIVPIVLQPTRGWTETEFGTFQALPKDAKPVSQWANQEAAYANIVDGIRKVCKEIVDWENPYRRAVAGDWVEAQVVTRLPGHTVVARIRVDLIARTSDTATARVVGLGDGPPLDRQLRVPLGEPLADNLQTMLGQFGEQMPAHASIALEETGRDEESLIVGGRRYHCLRTGRRLRVDTGGGRATVENTTWHCIDVPLDGIVKSEGTMRDEAGRIVYETTQVLTGFGHGTQRGSRAGTSRPVTAPSSSAGGLATRTRTRPGSEPAAVPVPAGVYYDGGTGLMWTINDNGKPVSSWQAARRIAKRKTLGGYSDWRLPTIEELEDLYDPERGDFRIRAPFSLTSPLIWSSTLEDREGWFFSFFSGKRGLPDYLMGRSGHYPHVLCVREAG